MLTFAIFIVGCIVIWKHFWIGLGIILIAWRLSGKRDN